MFNLLESYCSGYRAAIGRDSAGGVTQDFTPGDPGVTTLFDTVACSYQEASARTQMYYAQRDATVDAEVIFGQEVEIEPNDLIVLTRPQSGTVLQLRVEGEVQPIEQGFMWTWKVPVSRVRQPT